MEGGRRDKARVRLWGERRMGKDKMKDEEGNQHETEWKKCLQGQLSKRC